MSTTINNYSVGLTLDASSYIDSAKLSRSETKMLVADINKARDPAENFSRTQERLEKAYKAGAIELATYNRLLEHHKQKMESANPAVEKNASTLERMSQMSNVVTGSITAARAAIDVFVAGKDQIDQITDRIAGTADAARTLGLSFTELTSLRFAASQAGAGIESLEGAIKQMMKRGFAGDDVKESFLSIADEISGMASQTERMQRAYEVFGKQGADVLLMLQEGRDAIEENVAFADKWNRLTEGQVIGAEEYGDTVDRIGVVWSGIANIVGAELAPVLTLVGEEMLGVYDSWENVEGVVQDAVDNVVYVAGWIKDIKDVTDLWVKSMYRVVTLDFSGLANDINEALDFSTADEYLTRVQQIRYELEQKGMERTKKLEQEQEHARLQRIVDEQRQKKELAEKAIQDEAKIRADAEAKSQQEALRAEEQRQQHIQKMMEQSLNASSKKLEEEAKKAMAIQESIAKGPASFEVGSAGAAQYTAGLTNAALASTVMTDAIAPGEQALLDEAAKQFEQMVELNKKQAEQVAKLSELVTVTKDNAFKRIR
jgi:hypothetical protein